ncbi:hypothetical protein VST7929_03148 [Vibrio stylophorae]|uniref:Toxin-antitoxin system YwqK family antitoxin n=1 Tax=Vibrio stylophorae TaxID=659351 RepID=A0ABM8ZXU1_9VIBR|nr:hypothetical protein [Vibrio stylophorae]CAH0535626.1 hypothetical protein VST7929_03148 [Vibrio stylophorae]
MKPVKLKWTIKGKFEVVYTGTLKAMQRYSGAAKLYHRDSLYAQGECDNGLKVGFWQHYHGNGQVMLEGSYDAQGLEHGCWQLFYDDGQLNEIDYFDHGRRVGESQSFYQSGELRHHYWYDDQGRTALAKSYYRSGQLRHLQEMQKGRLVNETYFKADGSVWTAI